MAKKKTAETANIKAAPVLRAQGEGEQPTPTPTPEQTGTRTYQIMDPWKDRDVINLVDVKAVDGEITEVKVNGQPAGGGGGVPIYHIEWNVVNGPVTVDMNSIGLKKKLLYTLYQGGTYTVVDSNGFELIDGASSIDVACFQPRGVLISLMSSGEITVNEGSATYDSEQGIVIITGDCKLTLTVA